MYLRNSEICLYFAKIIGFDDISIEKHVSIDARDNVHFVPRSCSLTLTDSLYEWKMKFSFNAIKQTTLPAFLKLIFPTFILKKASLICQDISCGFADQIPFRNGEGSVPIAMREMKHKLVLVKGVRKGAANEKKERRCLGEEEMTKAVEDFFELYTSDEEDVSDSETQNGPEAKKKKTESESKEKGRNEGKFKII